MLITSRYRAACEDVILGDFVYAQANNVQAGLWDMHLRINNLYKTELRNVGPLTHPKWQWRVG